MKKILLLCFLSTSLNSFSQITELQDIVQDLSLIAEKFAYPAAQGAALQGSAAWFNSATALEQWKVDVSVHGNSLFIPKSKKSFSISNSDLRALKIRGVENAKIPTAFGGETDVFFEGEFANLPLEFQALEGIGLSYVPHAFVQAGVGLPRQTEVVVRFMPNTSVDGVEVGTYGLGIKHNFTQYYSYNREAVQIAAGISYSRINVNYGFKPVNIQVSNLSNIDVKADVFMLEILGSKKWNYLELFAGLGLVNSSFDYEMGGEGEEGLAAINNELKRLGDQEFGLKGDVGLNIFLGKFVITPAVSIGELVNANLGLHFRI